MLGGTRLLLVKRSVGVVGSRFDQELSIIYQTFHLVL